MPVSDQQIDRLIGRIDDLINATMKGNPTNIGRTSSYRGGYYDDESEDLDERLRKEEEAHKKRMEWDNADRKKKKEMQEEERRGNEKNFKEAKEGYDSLGDDIEKLERKLEALANSGKKNTEEYKNLQIKINSLKAQQNQYASKAVYFQKQLNQQEEERNRRAETLQQKIQRIKSGVEATVKAVQNFNDAWAKADHAASQYTKTLGGTKDAMDRLRRATVQNVVHGKIGINFNMSVEELLKVQEDYVKAIGRNLSIDNTQQTTLAAMSRVMSPENAAQLGVLFENFGVGLNQAGEHAGKMFKEATEYGISFDKYSQNVRENISIAQNYTFQNGLRGLENMAKKATAIKLDMKQVEAFANKVNTIEGSMETAAKLQVLGGPFANIADPMGMLKESLTDMEGLTDRVIRMIGGLGSFNRATGEVNVTGFNKRRIQEAAVAMGMDYNTLMTSVNAKARREEVERQIATSASAMALPKKMRELIANTATFENGRAGITVNGQFKALDEIKGEDYGPLIAETQSQSADIKQIAKDLRSLLDIREGAKKQYEVNKARISEKTGLGGLEKWTTRLIGGLNTVLSIVGGITLFNSVAGGIARFFPDGRFPSAGIRGRGGKGFSRFFSRGAGRAATQGAPKVGALGSTGGSTIFKGGFIRSANRLGLKAFGRTGLRAAGRFAGPLAGVTEGIFTAVDEFGSKKNYGTGKKIGRTVGSTAGGIGGGIATGAAIGAFAGPIGALIGGAIGAVAGSKIGKWIGGGFASQERRERWKNKLGLGEVQGDYSVKKLKAIETALATGKISNKLKDEMLKKGDKAVVDKIRTMEKKEDVKKNIAKAYFNVENAEFLGKNGEVIRSNKFGKALLPHKTLTAFGPIGVALQAGKMLSESADSLRINAVPEKGYNAFRVPSVKREREEKTQIVEKGSIPSSINISVNGAIKLTDSQGRSFDIAGSLLKDTVFVRELTQLISKQIGIDDKGTYVPKKSGK